MIETPPQLSEGDRDRAVELGPSSVLAPDALRAMVTDSGLRLVKADDVTGAFRSVVVASIDRLRADEVALRRDEGHDGFEAELGKKERMLVGIDDGLLRRTFVVAERV